MRGVARGWASRVAGLIGNVLMGSVAMGCLVLVAGCDQGEVRKVETVTAPVADPLVEAKAILTNYANGMPVTSEAESFAALAERVKAKDPAKGEILGAGLEQIKQNPGSAKSKAKELLPKL